MQRLLIIASPWYKRSFEKFRDHIPETDFFIKILPKSFCESTIAPYANVPSPRILKVLKNFEPDAILTDYTGLPNWWSKLYKFSSKRKIPLIFRLRGDWWTESGSRHNYYKSLFKKIGFLAWVRPMRGVSMKFPELIIPICHWLSERVREKLPKTRTEVIYQGVDPEEWYFDPEFENINNPSVGIYQDSNVPLKTRGLVWFSKVMKRMSDTNFYIAGGGKYMKTVRQKCTGLKNVHFLHRLNLEEGRRFLSTVNVYVLPSGLDCCPTSLLEAGLAMRPSIASKVGGIPELVLEGKTGWTLENGLTRTWEERIRTLLENQRFARRMGQNARKHVSSKFSWQNISKRLVSIIKQEISIRQ